MRRRRPPPVFAPPDARSPQAKVTLNFACNGLVNMDVASKSDPQVARARPSAPPPRSHRAPPRRRSALSDRPENPQVWLYQKSADGADVLLGRTEKIKNNVRRRRSSSSIVVVVRRLRRL